MTRVATAQNEDYLLMIADHGTAAHVERLVRNYRRVQRSEALERDKQLHALREFNWYIDDDGSYVLKGRLSPDQGARVVQALDTAMGALHEEQRNPAENVSAETPVAAKRADALERIADTFLINSDNAAIVKGGDRCTLHLHTDISTLSADGDGAESELANGGHVSAETSRRLACDCGVVHRLVHEGGCGLTIESKEPVFTAPNGKLVPQGRDMRFSGNVRNSAVCISLGELSDSFHFGPPSATLRLSNYTVITQQ